MSCNTALAKGSLSFINALIPSVGTTTKKTTPCSPHVPSRNCSHRAVPRTNARSPFSPRPAALSHPPQHLRQPTGEGRGRVGKDLSECYHLTLRASSNFFLSEITVVHFSSAFKEQLKTWGEVTNSKLVVSKYSFRNTVRAGKDGVTVLYSHTV